MLELEDLSVGVTYLTPSGRRAVLQRKLTGASKRDLCERVILRYEGGGTKDLVTLQPHQLRRVPSAPLGVIPVVATNPPPPARPSLSGWIQLALI